MDSFKRTFCYYLYTTSAICFTNLLEGSLNMKAEENLPCAWSHWSQLSSFFPGFFFYHLWTYKTTFILQVTITRQKQRLVLHLLAENDLDQYFASCTKSAHKLVASRSNRVTVIAKESRHTQLSKQIFWPNLIYTQYGILAVLIHLGNFS